MVKRMLWVTKLGATAFSELSFSTTDSLRGLPAETGANSIWSLRLAPANTVKNFLKSAGKLKAAGGMK